jgi:hypothetical protein
MRRAHSHAIARIAAALASAVVLSACAGNVNSDALGSGTALQAPVAPFGQAAIQNDAGQYGGTTKDSTFGNGTATASLAQDAHVVGGLLTATFGTISLSNSVAAQTMTGAALAGVEVATVNGGACSFSLSATYNTAKHLLKGTYQAVHGCSGETGSFSLTKECYYPRNGPFDAVPSWNREAGIKPNNGLHQC